MSSEHTGRLSFVDRLEALIPEMRAFARSLCRDAVLADDLVQDACLRAWSSSDSFDPNQPMRPWIFRILRNEFYMMLRRAWRNVNVDPEFVAAALIEESTHDVRRDFGRMEQIIYALPDKQRDAFLLVVAAGLTYDEAGEVCDCSPGTIKSRVSRARETVIARFESTEPTQPRTGRALGSDLDELLRRIDALTAGKQAAA